MNKYRVQCTELIETYNGSREAAITKDFEADYIAVDNGVVCFYKRRKGGGGLSMPIDDLVAAVKNWREVELI